MFTLNEHYPNRKNWTFQNKTIQNSCTQWFTLLFLNKNSENEKKNAVLELFGNISRSKRKLFLLKNSFGN